MVDAVKWLQMHIEFVTDLTAAVFAEESEGWQKRLDKWYDSHDNPDPFEEHQDGMCRNHILIDLHSLKHNSHQA
jgi:hypothetical protein